MSQQEFEPQQNERPFYNHSDSVQENTSEREARPYYWSTKPNTGNIPKNEHPANFEDSVTDLPPIPPYSYQAQDRSAQGSYAPQQQQSRHNLSPDGDAMEHGYKPYGSYHSQVPPWARPQHGNKVGRIIFFSIIGFMLIKPLLALLGALLVFVGVARPPFGWFRSPRQGRRWY
ncbi:MAG: hypothetical protein NVS9B9_24830 [Ktedonobacteraceae bacterium]